MVITSSTYLISSPSIDKCPVADRPEYAFIGRSNVGKSSLINMITGNEKLAKTSRTPGKTQLINHFTIQSQPDNGKGPKQDWYLVDLPGYGFAKVSQQQRKSWERMIEDYLRKRENLVNVFVLIDGRHEPQKIDLEFINKLGEWQIPFCIVVTKSDKETQAIVQKNVKSFLNAMRKTWQFLPRIIVSSAVKKLGKQKILELIEEMNTEVSK